MGGTCSNQSKRIVYKISGHTAIATVPDVCYNPPPPGTPVPYENSVTDILLVNGAATVTVSGRPVMTMKSQLGPNSNPAHPGVLGGVCSGTYRGEAIPKSGSPDFYAEGEPVIRTGDPTGQNADNCAGEIVGSYHWASAAPLTDLRAKKCSITTFVGKRASDGIPLGYLSLNHSGDPFYLEIKSDDSVILEAVREDTLTGAKEPCCQEPDHTHWYVEITTYPRAKALPFDYPSRTTITEAGATAIDLPMWALNFDFADIFSAADAGVDKFYDKLQDKLGVQVPYNEVKERSADIYVDKFVGGYNLDRLKQHEPGDESWSAVEKQQKLNPGDNAETLRRLAADDMARKQLLKEKLEEKYGKINKVAVALWQLLKFIDWRLRPPVMQISAKACGGARNAQIVVFPESTYTWSVSHTVKGDKQDDWVKKLIKDIEKCKKSVEKLKEIAEVAATNVNFEVHVLDTYTFSLEAEYLPCTVEKEVLNPFTGEVLSYISPSHIGVSWVFTIAVDPLISIGFSYKYNLIRLLSVLPGIGTIIGNTAGWVLDKLKTGVYLTLGVTLGSSLSGALTLNQDWVPGGSVKAAVDFDINLKASVEVTSAVTLIAADLNCVPQLSFEVELLIEKTSKLLFYLAYCIRITGKVTAFPGMFCEIEVVPETEMFYAGCEPNDPYDTETDPEKKKKRILIGERPIGGA